MALTFEPARLQIAPLGGATQQPHVQVIWTLGPSVVFGDF